MPHKHLFFFILARTKLNDMKLTVIGGGNMGLTFAKGIHASGLLGNQISILEKGEESLNRLKIQEKDFQVFDSPEKCIKEADIIIVAVKPFHASEVFEGIKPFVNSNQLFISLMAGVKMESIQLALGISKIVRTMPNLPAMIGKGMTGYTSSKDVSVSELETVEKLLTSTGEAVKVDSEDDIDKITGLSGSGSAYVFYFMEAMMNGADELGFNQEDSKKIIIQTFEGAVELFKQNGDTTSQWIDKVCSKGGTTIAAINSFEKNKVNEHINQGVKAAYDRAVELGKE
jgi:pyrroline-5-carboxylate reductase